MAVFTSLLALASLASLASLTSAQANPFSAGMQTYDLSLPPAVWTQLQLDALDEDWVPATLSIAGAAIPGEVGLRFKGGTGSLKSCFDDGVRNFERCPRLSMKIKFTKYDGPPYVDGIETLNFHSMIRDDSKMAEKISYKLFNDVGVPAPRSSWAKLAMNGEALGLFSLVDQIDDVFIKRIDAGDGQLYKEEWIGDGSAAGFEGNLKEGSSDHTPILAVQEALRTSGGQCRLSTLGQYFDVPQFYNYMAVDAAIANWDGVTGFYCGSATGGCGNANFYIYRTLGNAYTLLPWDMDNTFKVSNSIFDRAAVPHWLTPGDCSARYPLSFNNLFAKSAGCSSIFQALAEDPAQFNSALDSLLAGAFSNIEAEIEQYRTFLAPHVDAGEMAQWEAAVDELKAGLPGLRTRALGYKSITPRACGGATVTPPTSPTSPPDCYGPGERNQGEVGFPRVEYAPCCDGRSAMPKSDDWGFFCPSAGPTPPPTDCYAPGERNQGAPGFPRVEYKPCCDGRSASPKSSDWGFFCPADGPTTPPTAGPTTPTTGDCYGPGERNQGAPGFPRVEYKPCCDGQSASPKSGDWGFFCPSGTTPTNCYGPGERNQGASGFPRVEYKPCCDGQSALPKSGNWGFFCPV